MANKFKQAVSAAKRLYKTGRYKTFADAVKAAYKKLPKGRKKSVGKVRRRVGSAKRKRIVIVTRKTRIAAAPAVSSISGAKQTMKSYYADKLKNALYKKDQAQSKRLKKAWGKLIAKYRSELKKYS